MPKRIENPTPEQLKRREQTTRWARRRREQEVAERNRGAAVCQKRMGQNAVCGGRLEDAVDRRSGKVTTSCPRCVRRAAGICVDCPRPVEGQLGFAVRCAACKVLRRRDHSRNYAHRHKAEMSAKWKQQYRALPPEERQQKLEAKKIWRRANPEKVQEYRQRERETRRDKINAYHKQRREAKRAEINQKARAYYYAHSPRPTIKPCVDCGGEIQWAPPGRPKKRCDACVPPSIRARRRPVVPEYERPQIAAAARTCVTRGCRTVVNGRAKKCFVCKQKQTQVARMLLGSRRAA